MNQIYVIYHLARADFLERVRRYSFLIMLGAVVFLGYQTAIGNLSLELDQYRGEFNSAWVGAMMSVIATFIVGWGGFFLVKGSLARDRETGVGQILATTPLTRPLYLLGKWLSNFAVLMTMIAVLMVAGILIQLIQGENRQIMLGVYLEPFVYIVMPIMAMVAALAVFFETIPFLQGGFGNVVFFLSYIMSVPFFLENETLQKYPAFEPLGVSLLYTEMGKVVRTLYTDYQGGFTIGGGHEAATTLFVWNGIHWTSEYILARFSFFLLAIALVFLGTLFFDRFDPSRSKPRRTKSATPLSAPVVASTPQALSQPVHLTPLSANKNHFAFGRVLISELKLLLKGQRWWWYVAMLGFIIAGVLTQTAVARQYILPLTWIFPILIWSGVGNREMTNNTQQMVFSSAAPLMRQLPAQWLAGFIVTVLTGIGVFINLLTAGDTVGLLAWTSAAIFIPSFALALGVFSNSHKLFEVLYMLVWYVGPMNNVPAVDYLGAKSNGNLIFFIPFSIVLIVAAFVGRARQLRN